MGTVVWAVSELYKYLSHLSSLLGFVSFPFRGLIIKHSLAILSRYVSISGCTTGRSFLLYLSESSTPTWPWQSIDRLCKWKWCAEWYLNPRCCLLCLLQFRWLLAKFSRAITGHPLAPCQERTMRCPELESRVGIWEKLFADGKGAKTEIKYAVPERALFCWWKYTPWWADIWMGESKFINVRQHGFKKENKKQPLNTLSTKG